MQTFSRSVARRPDHSGSQTSCCLSIAVVVSMLLVLAVRPAIAGAKPSVDEIIQHSVEANDRDWDADPHYDYSERDRVGSGSKTYAVTFIAGTPYQRLIAIDGKPLPPAQAAEEENKLKDVTAKRLAESPDQKSQRIAKYDADRKRDHAMLAQLTKAFDFRLVGEQMLAGHNVYVLLATPRAGYHPPDRDTQVLPGMRGKLWIEQASFQWVKVEAHVIRPVAIEGFLARVQPGTRFELEKSPVAPDIWLPRHFAMKAAARVLFVIEHRSQQDEYYFNYHRNSDSTISSRSSSSGP
jgi:hypothetical protein